MLLREKAQVPLTEGELAITRHIEPDTVVLALQGEIDLASAPTLERELREVENTFPTRIVLDFAGLEFLDSTGLHLLINAQLRAEARGHELVLTDVPGHVEQLFTLTGIHTRLTLQ